MKNAIYLLSCWAIALWTLGTAATSVWFFGDIIRIQAELGSVFDMTGEGGAGLIVLWLLTQLATWSAVVVPLALIAILARPSWPVSAPSATAAGYEPIRARGAEPVISPASPASAPRA